ncbi:MAG TPA: amidohydrolase family protein [Planctomycetota bacterium]|nr:amidohydrolase family protein [Planctomycetota bacterium]
MRLTAGVLLVALLAAASGLPAQGRNRFPRRTEGGGQPAVPESKPEPAGDKKPPKTHLAIVGGDVYLGTGQRLTGATVLVGDDKILAVGTDLELPAGTTVLDAKGKTVSPGFVCVVGNGMGAGRSSPFIDSVNPFDPEIKQALAAGITSFLAGSPAGGNMPGGDTAVIKLAYGDVTGMVLKEGTVLGLSVPLPPADLDKLFELIKKTRDHRVALEEFGKKKSADANAKPPEAPPGSDKLLKVLAGEARLWITLGGAGGGGRRGNPFGGGGNNNDTAAIRQAMDIAQRLGTGVVLQKPVSAWLVADEIAATGSMVILSPRDRVPADPADPDRTGSNLASAAILAETGVPVAVTCPAGGYGGGAGVGTGGIMGQDLNTPHLDAAFAVRGGLDNRKALRTLTLDAARIMGVDKRIGSIEPGKDADILILDGDPLHYRTFVETAVVNGKVVYVKDQEPFYSHIKH